MTEVDKNNILLTIEKQLKGEIYDELTPKEKYYELCIFSKIFTPDFEMLRFPVPNLKTALLIIDAICLSMKHRKIDNYYFGLLYKNNINDEWEDWEDEYGNVITDYEIDENFNMYLPSELEE